MDLPKGVLKLRSLMVLLQGLLKEKCASKGTIVANISIKDKTRLEKI